VGSTTVLLLALSLTGLREDDAVVSYVGRFAPALAVTLASIKGGEPTTVLTSSRSNTTNGDATGGGHIRARTSNAKHRFAELSEPVVAIDCLEHVPRCVAICRACPRVPASPKMHPSRTREESEFRHHGQHQMTICRAFVQAL
jgi:hypothetical protein